MKFETAIRHLKLTVGQYKLDQKKQSHHSWSFIYDGIIDELEEAIKILEEK